MTGNVSETDLEAWLAFALACCDEADALALSHFRRDMVIETKPDRSFVTEVDQAIERRIRERIAADWARALVRRPDRRHPQFHPWRSALRDAPGRRSGR